MNYNHTQNVISTCTHGMWVIMHLGISNTYMMKCMSSWQSAHVSVKGMTFIFTNKIIRLILVFSTILQFYNVTSLRKANQTFRGMNRRG